MWSPSSVYGPATLASADKDRIIAECLLRHCLRRSMPVGEIFEMVTQRFLSATHRSMLDFRHRFAAGIPWRTRTLKLFILSAGRSMVISNV